MAQQLQQQDEPSQSTFDKLVVIIYPRIRSILSGTASGIAKCIVGHPFDTMLSDLCI